MEKEQLTVLVKKSQSGDGEAMEQLLQFAHTSVSFQCRKMLKHPQDAEDMTQEVLVTIYTKLNTLQGARRLPEMGKSDHRQPLHQRTEPRPCGIPVRGR